MLLLLHNKLVVTLKYMQYSSIITIIIGYIYFNTFKLTSGNLERLESNGVYILEDSLHGTDEDIRLEDFFWTGSGDGPPTYARNPDRPITDPVISGYGKETIIKTATVVATVYVDGNTENDPICLFDCNNSNRYPQNFEQSDRRYWLLTVVSGYFRYSDFPILEDKLATLYRMAFARQQSRHLGIGNRNKTLSYNYTDVKPGGKLRRKRNSIKSFENIHYKQILNVSREKSIIKNYMYQNHNSYKDNSTYFNKINSMNFNIDNNNISRSRQIDLRASKRHQLYIDYNTSSTSVLPIIDFHSIYKRNIINTIYTSTTKSSLAYSHQTPLTISSTNQHDNQEFQISRSWNKNDNTNNLSNSKMGVQVTIHNLTLMQNYSVEYDRMDATKGIIVTHPEINQTEIIYTVFVDGVSILATTAAEDMKLVSKDEVAKIMGKLIYTKAEPYLKEPQATPLVPASTSNIDISQPNATVGGFIAQNPVMFAITLILLALLIILLIGLLLLIYLKRTRKLTSNGLTSTQVLLTQKIVKSNKNKNEPTSTENLNISRIESEEVADNLAFHDRDGGTTYRNFKSSERGTPRLHFPAPPTSPPSSSSTSDSSIYYPKKISQLNIQRIVNERVSKRQFNGEEAFYATVTKKNYRNHNKQKSKRKYLSVENKVGSLQEDQADLNLSSRSSSDINDMYDTVHRRHSNNKLSTYQQFEAINPNVKSRSQIGRREDINEANSRYMNSQSPTDTYNKDIIKTINDRDKSPATGSIGSFLSMASVRSFPQCFVPEPLSRVLEPLSVTHLEHTDAEYDTVKRLPSVIDIKKKNAGIYCPQTNYVDYNKSVLNRSQSDGADPGVIGPVVWEIHKRKITARDTVSPLIDPVAARNRFDGLLEGAIKLYSDEAVISDVDNLDVCTTNDVPGVIRPKEVRGKSANILRQTTSLAPYNSNNRPVTASELYTSNEYSVTQPPSPYRRAWGSGTPSPLVRPLSAGPFHRPDQLVDVISILQPQTHHHNITTLSTAPLIEAIQEELKKFDRNK